jgi:Calcineurin-like phosphoesterase
MISPATDSETLLGIAQATLASLQTHRDSLESVGDVHPDAVTNALSAALDWARLEKQASQAPATEESVIPPRGGEPYIPTNQILALLQSAYDEYMESRGITEAPFDSSDPGWATIAQEKLKAAIRGKHPFIPHSSLTSFRYDLPENAVVALFSDWGTGEATAQRVMQQIALQRPTHAIHLGDVYYAGTPKEAKERFLDIIDQHGPPKDSCRYLSLPGNHDYYSGGYAYFDSILPNFGQEASYFNLRNQHWQVIGLDSGYEEAGLKDPQLEWLSAQLDGSAPQSILLSHHQLFSPYDKRALSNTLLPKVTALLPRVHAWFWGHEHRCIVMGDHLGIKARCIGNGAIPSSVPYGAPPFPEIPVQKVDERPAPPPDGGGFHGFALLRFAGANVDVSYIDEYGGEFYREEMP